MENAPEPRVRAPMIRRLLPVREVLAPKQLPPETARLMNNSDPFWALPMLANAYTEPTRSALRRREPVSLGGCAIVAIVIGDMGLAFFLILSLLGVWGANPMVPDVVPVFLTMMMRVGVPLVLAAFLALTGLAAYKIWSVRSR